MPPAPGLLYVRGRCKFSSMSGVWNGAVVTTAVPASPQSRPPCSESRPFSVTQSEHWLPCPGPLWGCSVTLWSPRGWAASGPRPEREQPPFTPTKLGTESLQHLAWVSYLGSNKSP